MSAVLRTCLLLAAAAVLISMAAPCAPVSAQDRDRARLLFERASTAREEGRWSDARALLEQSLGAYPTFSTAWNLVTVLEQLDDLPAAEGQLQGLRDGLFGQLDAERTQAVLERLERVSRELGTIVVEVGVEDILVSVDGTERAHTDGNGRASVRAAAGSHVVAIASAEGQAQERELDLERGQSRTLRFTLASRIEPATLVLEAAEPERTVRVVGVAEGVGRLELTLVPREYRLELVGGGTEQSIVLQPGHSEHVVLIRTIPVWESPWLWIAVGAVALGGAGIGVGVHFATSQVEPPVPAEFVAPAL